MPAVREMWQPCIPSALLFGQWYQEFLRHRVVCMKINEGQGIAIGLHPPPPHQHQLVRPSPTVSRSETFWRRNSSGVIVVQLRKYTEIKHKFFCYVVLAGGGYRPLLRKSYHGSASMNNKWEWRPWWNSRNKQIIRSLLFTSEVILSPFQDAEHAKYIYTYCSKK
jgi:hypothetical protein